MEVGELVKLYEHKNGYRSYKIIQVKDKGLYKMYLCENIKTKCKMTFTSKDKLEKIGNIIFVLG